MKETNNKKVIILMVFVTNKIAVIGGGISGIAFCLNAEKVQSEDQEITIFEKSSSLGGRTVTNTAGGFEFDLGAQYIETTDTPFQYRLNQWLEEGIVETWDATIGELTGSRFEETFKEKTIYVPIPKMQSLAEKLSSKLMNTKVVYNCKIEEIFKKFNEWYLQDQEENIYGPFSLVVLAISPGAAVPLVKDFEYLVEILNEVSMSPRFVLQLGFNSSILTKFDATFVNNSCIRWMARNNSKPLRPDKESWIIHASKKWTLENYTNEEETLETELFTEFKKICGFDDLEPEFAKVMLWNYGTVEESLHVNFILDNNRNIALIGDYCIGDNIESAYLSGEYLGQRVG